MKNSNLKRTQVKGVKYDLPEEEVEIEKLIQKGTMLMKRFNDVKRELEAVKSRLTEIATARRDNKTTINLKAISGKSVVTFRESYVCDKRIDEIQHELGSLFDRFFIEKRTFKTTKDLKQFLDGDHGLGMDDPEKIKRLIMANVARKTTKPNVKIIQAKDSNAEA